MLEKKHENRIVAQERVSAGIAKPLAEVTARPGDLVLVKEAESTRRCSGRGGKLEHERWTGPWAVKRVLQEGLSVEV